MKKQRRVGGGRSASGKKVRPPSAEAKRARRSLRVLLVGWPACGYTFHRELMTTVRTHHAAVVADCDEMLFGKLCRGGLRRHYQEKRRFHQACARACGE